MPVKNIGLHMKMNENQPSPPVEKGEVAFFYLLARFSVIQ